VTRGKLRGIGYDSLIEAIRSVPPERAFEGLSGRPRMDAEDPRLARRRAQYRNAKRRARGLEPELVPVAPRKPYRGSTERDYRTVSVWLGSRWAPAIIDSGGRRIFLGAGRD
jgi:hypothetical protein